MMATEAERLAPRHLEAEQAVLGAVLLDGRLFSQAAQHLVPEDFYLQSHRKIFHACIAIAETRSVEAIDLVTMREKLVRDGDLEDIGGSAYLSRLVDGLPRYSNIEYYVRIVREKSLLRSLILACERIINDCYSSADEVQNIVDRAQTSVFSVADKGLRGGFVHVGDLAAPAMEKLAKMVDSGGRAVTGVPTGFRDLDGITSGLQGSDLIVLASRPGMGKTSLALNIAVNAAKESRKVGVFSLEMSIEQLFMRMICAEARLSSQKLRTGWISDADFRKLAAKLDRFVNLDVYVDDTPALGLMEARAKARRLKAERGLDLVIIDYLQLMTSGQKFENRNLEIGHITHGLKALAKELSVPVLLLSQLSRAPESRSDHRPLLSDLRESGNIEQDADIVGFIFRKEFYTKEQLDAGKAELIVAKHRNGPVGTVNLVFLSEQTRFLDASTVAEE